MRLFPPVLSICEDGSGAVGQRADGLASDSVAMVLNTSTGDMVAIDNIIDTSSLMIATV